MLLEFQNLRYIFFIYFIFLRFNLSWGQRADLEISKKDLLETVAKVIMLHTVK